MLVVCGGLQRTGSTVMWQIMGDLVLANGGAVPATNQNVHHWAQEWANSSEVMLAKSHNYKSTFTDVLDRVKVVMTVRDPRDVVVSLSHFLKVSPAELINDGVFSGICRNRREWIEKMPENSLFVVRYEDFMSRMAEAILDVSEFLEFPITSAEVWQLRYKWSLGSNLVRSLIEDMDKLDRRFVSSRQIHDGSVGQWPDELSPFEIIRIEEMASDWMTYHNYTPWENPAGGE